ncbi:MAG: MBOAT family O-acyltransferase [Bacteroidota bacterium]
MPFNSFAFLYLLAVTFVIYYSKWFAKAQVVVLIVASLVFYAHENFVLLALLLFSAAVNITTSYRIVYGDPKHRRLIAVTGVVVNLAALSFFKYSRLFAHTLLSDDSSIAEFLINIPLPIGISFFTFEGISLLIDVWKERHIEAKKIIALSILEHARNTLFFISFFPHLIAGPILKAHDFFPQIGTKYFKNINWESAFKSIVTGYFLKMVVADNLKNFTFWIVYPFFEGQSTATLISLLFGYSIQIFADFAGYSLIAIGLAKLFGYQFQDNFNFPYISTSFREFWKRWHISLSTFLMEYLYFPLGGNRKGKIRTYFNLMVTMILGGLWHGAAWSYAVWGFVHGSALAVERALSDKINLKPRKLISFIQGLFVFLFVTFAWLLFKLPDFSHVTKYINAIATNTDLETNTVMVVSILIYSSPVVLYHVLYLMRVPTVVKLVQRVSYVPYGVMLFLIVTNSGSSGSFIYFQF